MEIERLQAEAPRDAAEVLNNARPAEAEREWLMAEEKRIRAQIDHLTHSIDDTINGQPNGHS